MAQRYDLIIVGMGSGGMVAAEFASTLDLRVAAVERDRMGGDCLWTGCVPSKALLASAKVAHHMRTADHYGITAVEQPVSWARHIVRTRALQKETGGFTEFVGLPFVHMAAPIYLQHRARRGPTWREVVLMHAVGRIAYHGLIDNIQASWVKLGVDGAQQLLHAGVNDLGGTLMNESISRAAGAAHGQGVDEDDFRAIVEPLGRTLEQRTTLYGRVAGV